MGRAARIGTGTSAAVILLGVAVVLALLRRGEQLSSALASLGCCVAGFAVYVAVEGVMGRVVGVAVALAIAALGVWWLGGSSLLVATFGILAVGVLVVTADLLTPPPRLGVRGGRVLHPAGHLADRALSVDRQHGRGGHRARRGERGAAGRSTAAESPPTTGSRLEGRHLQAAQGQDAVGGASADVQVAAAVRPVDDDHFGRDLGGLVQPGPSEVGRGDLEP
ncbi:hypothetical protein EV644_11970 [Kribbella orskensis]|uniref:Uncharacterized protein n=1 Tax=Kribbella orskensis TaxID=2512216 RepID=A0ABY2BC73_9ACTN|nr:hypothetical protein EV642_12073 [Kribbella sp. VKM Ac-2500]TCO14957.1 hypothetical protein EV644_11970 [Kribbella orskensis]